MQVTDIKVVLRLAKVRAEQGSYSNDEYAANHASIEAVETWLREVGALPPERSATQYGSPLPDMTKVMQHAHRKRKTA